MKKYWYEMAIVLMIMVIGFSVKSTVRGQEQVAIAAKEQFYREQEKILLHKTEDLLTRMGYCHCGITLNRVVEGETERTYTFTIHHRKIDQMEEEELGQLKETLKALTEGFPCAVQEDSCKFCYQFLKL